MTNRNEQNRPVLNIKPQGGELFSVVRLLVRRAALQLMRDPNLRDRRDHPIRLKAGIAGMLKVLLKLGRDSSLVLEFPRDGEHLCVFAVRHEETFHNPAKIKMSLHRALNEFGSLEEDPESDTFT